MIPRRVPVAELRVTRVSNYYSSYWNSPRLQGGTQGKIP